MRSEIRFPHSIRPIFACPLWVIGTVLIAAGHAKSQTAQAEPGKRVAVATSVSETGMLMRREAVGKPWQAVAKDGALYAGDLLIGFPGALADSKDKSVRITFLSDLDDDSPFPIAENALELADAPGVDLAFRLDRGRVDLVNQKKSGAAKVRVQVRKDVFDLNLSEPGASVALELYGRWAAGVPFNREPDPKDAPTASLIVLARKGHVDVKHGAVEFAMTAPPGPALIEWDSLTGLDRAPRRLEKLPPWASEAPETPQGKARKAVLDKLRKAIVASSIGAALDQFINSSEPGERVLAVRAMAAFDDLERLSKAMRETKHADVWDAGVLALRHWIGRGPGQDQILYKGIMERGGFSAIEAETILQLLHSYGEVDLSRPETFETLIAYLNHEKLPIRGLAHWHLVRLVPAGKEIAYNPMESKEKRAAAIEKWKKLVPNGTLPQRTRAGQ
jgi:hypothetical protein